MTRQQEIIEEVRRLLEELELLGQKPKEYELGHPFERAGLCSKCNNKLPYGTYGTCSWCQEYNRIEL